MVEAIKEQSSILRADGCHIIIGLGHIGIQDDVNMASLVDLDVIIGGHSHTLLSNKIGLDPK